MSPEHMHSTLSMEEVACRRESIAPAHKMLRVPNWRQVQIDLCRASNIPGISDTVSQLSRFNFIDELQLDGIIEAPLIVICCVCRHKYCKKSRSSMHLMHHKFTCRRWCAPQLTPARYHNLCLCVL